MSMLARVLSTKTKHNRRVEEIADVYHRDGYRVKADHIESYPSPDTYRGYRPDVVAEKSGHKTLIEVETEDSVGTKRDRKQRGAFKNWRSRKETRHFKREVV